MSTVLECLGSRLIGLVAVLKTLIIESLSLIRINDAVPNEHVLNSLSNNNLTTEVNCLFEYSAISATFCSS